MMKINWKTTLTASAVLIGGALLTNEFAQAVIQDSIPATTTQPASPVDPTFRREPTLFDSGPSDTPPRSNLQPDSGSRYLDTSPRNNSEVDPFSSQSAPARRQNYSQEFLSSLNALQNPEAEGPQRDAARDVVSKVLVEQFDEDMKSRQQQLEQLEKTLARLKAQFEKRKASRDQIVQLQLQLIENDAAGLGFPTSWNRMRGMRGPSEPFVDQFDRVLPSDVLPADGIYFPDSRPPIPSDDPFSLRKE